GKSRTVFVTTWVEVLVLVLMLLPATVYLGLAGTSGAALLGGIVVLLLAGRYANCATGMSLSDWRGAVQYSLVAGVIACGVGDGWSLASHSDPSTGGRASIPSKSARIQRRRAQGRSATRSGSHPGNQAGGGYCAT